MKTLPSVHLTDVQDIYSGAIGRLWEFVMGEQIHIGGFPSSCDLAKRAGIAKGMSGVDLCCCSGAGMRFLLKICEVSKMTGVDFTPAQLALGADRMKEYGLETQTRFICADAAETGLPTDSFDFVWGEDAWCYVENKAGLIAEAARLVRPGGVVAFTDWCEGPVTMTTEEANRFLNFMKFPSLHAIADYKTLLEFNGLVVKEAEDTGRYASCVELYIRMLTEQHTMDALRIIKFDHKMFEAMSKELLFIQELAHQNKIIQARFIAVKPA